MLETKRRTPDTLTLREGVHLLSEIQYRQLPNYEMGTPGIAYFPLLEKAGAAYGFKHGFSWGTQRNYSVTKEPEATQHEIPQRVAAFFADLGMNNIGRHFVNEGLQGTWPEGVLDLNADFLRGVEAESPAVLHEIKQREGTVLPNAISIPVNGMFTTEKNIPITHKPGDCVPAFLFAVNQAGIPVTGIIHTSRKEVAQKFAPQAIEFVIEHFNVTPEAIKLGIGPSLSEIHHTLKEEDLEKCLGDLNEWSEYIQQSETLPGIYHVNMAGYLLKQYASIIPPNNIEMYNVCTYEATARKQAFSRRYTTSHSLPLTDVSNGRPIMAVQL